MRPSTRTSITLLLGVLLVSFLAACSGGGATASPSVVAPTDPPAASPSEPAASPSPASPAPSTPTSAGGETVTVADSALGQILVDGEGKTLYLFTNDTAGESTCYDQCAAAWPPLLADGEITVGEGLDDSDFSTVARTDGTMQVKIGEWPLYYFANDAAAGDTNGQGINEVWYVVSPSGEAIK
jgi:predicted lipoprotein with Yx(FWY)xxD motif